MTEYERNREFVHSPYRRPDTAPTACMAAAAVRRPAVVESVVADEWWEGRHVFADMVTAQVQEMSSAGVRLSAGSPRLFEYGDVVCCVDPTLHLGDGTEVPMRVTLIAIPYSDAIQIKHSHFSVGR